MAENAQAVQGKRNIYTGNSAMNALSFLIETMQGQIATALPVTVVAAYPGTTTGYVDVLPLVAFVAGDGQTVQPVTLYRLPYSRVQGGICALIIDPVPGDKGLAVFSQADSSTVTAGTKAPQQPGSHRRHSMSDGYYIGGFLNQQPQCFLELTQEKKAVLTAAAGVTINGDITVNGKITATGDIKGNGHSLSNHTHTGAHGETSTANG